MKSDLFFFNQSFLFEFFSSKFEIILIIDIKIIDLGE